MQEIINLLYSSLVGFNMETDQQEGQEHQDAEKRKSPTHIIKEWAPVCEEELKPKE